jgi:hypothetical protein
MLAGGLLSVRRQSGDKTVPGKREFYPFLAWLAVMNFAVAANCKPVSVRRRGFRGSETSGFSSDLLRAPAPSASHRDALQSLAAAVGSPKLSRSRC